MHVLRNTLLIGFAILIDGAQVLISAAFMAVGAVPGTTAGAVAGAAAGGSVAGSAGAAAGAAIGGFFGSFLNVGAAVTLPMGIAMGFAVNMCIDVTLGTLLTMFLITQGMYYPRYGIGGWIAELVPGLNDLPAWTISTVLAVIRKSAEEGQLQGTPAGVFAQMTGAGTLAGAGIAALTNVKQNMMQTAQQTGSFTKEQQTQENAAQHTRIMTSELKNIDGIRASKPQTTPSNDTEVPAQRPRYAA